MPTPRPTSSDFYVWSFKVLHGLTGVIPRIIAIFWPDSAWAKIFNVSTADQIVQASDKFAEEKKQ
jgi:hypothetical protein